MGDIHPAITRSQHAYGERLLKNLSRRQLALAQCITLVDALLEQDNLDNVSLTLPNGRTLNSANCNEAPHQEALLANHEDMIEALDSYALSMCYLLKTRHFLPYLIKRHGPAYDYSVSVSDKLQSNSINLFIFSGDGEKAVQELWCNTTNIYNYLAQLQDRMDQNTLKTIINENRASEFLKKFCQGRPPNLQDCLGRMEYLFFKEHNIPLGIFADAPSHILKWIQRKNYDAIMSDYPSVIARTFRHVNKFPGVVFIAGKQVKPITTNGKYSLADRLAGPIPKEGVIIELDEKQIKPKTSQPRLVR